MPPAPPPAPPEDTRLTRTSADAGTARTETSRTEVTTRRGRMLVGALVRSSRWWRAARVGARTAAQAAARTIRPAGVVVLLAVTVGLVCGLVFGWVEWVVAAVAGLVLLVAAVPFLFSARSYDVYLRLLHDRVTAGDAIAASLVIRNVGRRTALPGRVDIPVGGGIVEVGVPMLRPGRDVDQPLRIPPQPRSVLRVGPATSVRADPVGLLHREHAFADVRDVFVHPRTSVLPSTSVGLIRDLDGAPTRRLVDADMSFHAIREYAPGDAQKQIHWKSTAKTGRLMVRQYEESRRSRMAVILGVADDEYRDEAEFELAVSCAASLGVRAVTDARELSVVVGADVPRAVRGRLRAIRHLPASGVRPLLDAFSGVRRLAETMALRDVCRLAAEAGERLSVAVVVTGSVHELGALQRAALSFPIDTVVVAVVCDERAHPRMQSFGGLTVLTVGALADLPGLLAKGAAT